MNPTEDNAGLETKSIRENHFPVRLKGSAFDRRPHICAFFNHPDEEYRILLPFIQEGLDAGEKAFHTLDPARLEDHQRRLTAGGLNVSGLFERGQLEVCPWTAMHLREGRFDQEKTLARFNAVLKAAGEAGFPLTRFITHMEWALENAPGVDSLLEYEARSNYFWLNQTGPFNPVICTYDLTKFGGEVVVDILRTHPLVIIGGILQENPFFVPPDEFLEELRQR